MNWIKKIFSRSSEDGHFMTVVDEQYKKNADVIKSLREYDEGKKDISTTELERRMPGLRVTPQK